MNVITSPDSGLTNTAATPICEECGSVEGEVSRSNAKNRSPNVTDCGTHADTEASVDPQSSRDEATNIISICEGHGPVEFDASRPELEVESSNPYNVDCDSPKESADGNEHHSPRDLVPSNNATLCERGFCPKSQAYEYESTSTRTAGIPSAATSDYPYDAASDKKDDCGCECDRLQSSFEFAGSRCPTDLTEHYAQVFEDGSGLADANLKYGSKTAASDREDDGGHECENLLSSSERVENNHPAEISEYATPRVKNDGSHADASPRYKVLSVF